MAGMLSLARHLIGDASSKACDVESDPFMEAAKVSEKGVNPSANIVETGVPLKQSNAGGPITMSSMQATSAGTVSKLLRDPVQLRTFTITPATTVGTVVYKSQVGPRNLTADGTTRIDYLSRLYRYWKGNFVFQFMFTKTILIQFKLIAVFVPGATQLSQPPSAAEARFLEHHVIMNPENTQEYSIECPFISTKPIHQMSEITGMFYVIVFQPLVISAADTNSIPVVVSVSSTDLEFREYDLLPSVGTSVYPVIPVNHAGSIMAGSGGEWLPSADAAATRTSAMTSDTGGIIVGTPRTVTVNGWTNESPIFETHIDSTPHGYNPLVERTVYGSPLIGATSLWERQFWLNTGVTKEYQACRYYVYEDFITMSFITYVASSHGRRLTTAVQNSLSLFPVTFSPVSGAVTELLERVSLLERQFDLHVQ